MKLLWPTVVTVALLLAGAPAAALNEAGPPLPPVETVLQRVAEQSAKADENEQAFQERYYFTRTRVTEYRNSKGGVKKREEKKRENDPRQKTHSNGRGKGFEKSDFAPNGDLLGRFEFTVTGREVLNGRPALIMDFQPAAKKLPERNFKDRFINKAAGRIWVDEADYTLVKADLHLTERVNVVGGLVGAVWKFTFGFIRERMPDGLWFTRASNWHLEGRELFVQRTVDYHEEKTDVRKVF